MRPEILNPLFASTTALPGVGPRVAEALKKLAGERVVDLCWHLPAGLIDRRFAPPVAEAPEGRIATLTVEVVEHRPGAGRQPYRVLCRDASGTLTLTFFHAAPGWLMSVLPPGSTRVVSGTVERWRGEAQMSHPDFIAPPEELASLQAIEPVYPMTAGLKPAQLRKLVRAALERVPVLPEWLDSSVLRREQWPAWREALLAAHAPEDLDAVSPENPARRRIAYDELLASQLALALVRRRQKRRPGVPIPAGDLARRAEAALPFRLTAAQQAALADVRADLASGSRMMRLVQGDVGSGKTVVAALAMLDVVEAGGQAALMAPTEILARQHLIAVSRVCEAVGVRVELLTGREKGERRAALLADLAGGAVPVVVGTHALFQDDVVFADLLLAVVDEQHRFGVEQRMRIADKGRGTHVLGMTATPIPRTLMLTAYGDLDSSRIAEKPPGRRPIDTRTVSVDRLDEVVAAVGRAIEGGAKAYWVCPLVEESEQVDLAAAEERFATLHACFGARVGLVHGKMKARERDAAMAAFREGPVDLLVATTVIEVGVDVPAASIMVIEHAERFGLAQLHQLRGRVGRGERASTCLLLYAAPLGETARARLETMRRTEDGFVIAEEDLRLRGAGEVLGTRQSGLPTFRLADLEAHADLLDMASKDAQAALLRDPDLTGPRSEALRTLLYLFERDAAVRYARTG